VEISVYGIFFGIIYGLTRIYGIIYSIFYGYSPHQQAQPRSTKPPSAH